MKSNEALYGVIGEIKAEFVPDTDKKKKASPLKWAAIGSLAAAAAVVGIFVMRGMGVIDFSNVNEWEKYRIYPEVTYKENVVIDELPKIYYEKGEYRSYLGSFSVNDFSELEAGSPWNESLKLTEMPVFKNLAYGEIPFRFYSKEQMLSMAENAAEAMGISADSVLVHYDWAGDDPLIDGEEIDFSEISSGKDGLPAYLKAVCGGEVYGVEKISIRVFGDGMIDVYFSEADDRAGMQLPEGYSFSSSPYSSEARKTVKYLSEKFKNLLQFEKPVCAARGIVPGYEYGVYGSSEDIAQSILNYGTAYASFIPNLVTNELSCITLINLPAVSEYMGEYPIISAEEAVKLLLDNADEYASYVPEQYLKNGGIGAEDIKKVELSYKDGIFEYLAPYYYIYAELSEIEETDTKIFGVFAVPAVKEEYISDTPIIQDDERTYNYRIYPEASYKDNNIDKVPQKIPYQSNEYMAVSIGSDYWYDLSQDWGNPWSEELSPQLTALPVFKDLAFYRESQYMPPHYYTEEQMREMAQKAAAALGVNIIDTFCQYDGSEIAPPAAPFYDEELPWYLKVTCDGGEYGTEKITMQVFGGGNIVINFGAGNDGRYLWLPNKYDILYESSDESEVEEALGYLADKFKNLLQFDVPHASVYTCKYDSAAGTMGSVKKVFNGSDDIVQSILNYNLAYAIFDSYQMYEYESSFNNEQKVITLINRLASAEYLGDYPVISPEAARELLLSEGYYVYMPDGYYKSGKSIDPEKIVKTELVYCQTDTGYFVPYYNIYVEKDKESENGYKQYLRVQVSAIGEEYFEAPAENDGLLTPDFDEEVFDAYPADQIDLPDGSTVSKTEAVGTDHDTEIPVLQFDFAFLRYSMPIFKSTFDDPDCYDFETGKPAEKIDTETEKPGYFKVQKGDKLDNGLTVISAESKTARWSNEDKLYENRVSFEGEITVEGYFISDYSIRFYPDITSGVSLPVVYCAVGDDPEWRVFSGISGSSEAILTDCESYFVGFDATLPDELTDALEGRDAVKGKVTLKNISLYNYQSNTDYMAEIVDFEFLE